MTVKEIAEKAGVSIGTVDRVLHGRGRVSPDTRAKIEAIIAEGSYKANPIARQLKRGKGYVFAVVLPRQDEDAGYWKLALEGVAKAAVALQPFRISLEIHEFDRNAPQAAARSLQVVIERGVDGILLAPVNQAEIQPILHKLKQSIPYVFFDALASGLAPLCVVGQDPYRSGYFAGRLMALFCPGPAELLVVNPHPSDLHLQSRAAGFKAYFVGQPEVVFTEATRLDAGRPQGVFVVNAALSELLAAQPALAGSSARPAIIGYDLVPDNVRLLRSGQIDCLISQRPEFQAYEGLMVLYRRVVLQENAPQRIDAPLEACFRENLPPVDQ